MKKKLAALFLVFSDGATWTITLKKNVTFSNGNPLTPEMVINDYLERYCKKVISA